MMVDMRRTRSNTETKKEERREGFFWQVLFLPEHSMPNDQNHFVITITLNDYNHQHPNITSLSSP